MSENKKKLFLTTIAKEKKMESAREVLAILIDHNKIYAHVEDVELTNTMIGMDFAITDLPVPEMYLQIIWSRGVWEGNRIKIRSFDAGSAQYRTTEATFSKDICLSIDDLFVYEDDLADLESLTPDIFARKVAASSSTENSLSPKLESSLYALVGILLDMLVDKKGDNYVKSSTLLDKDSEYPFKTQTELIVCIENNYEKHNLGLKSSTLETKFSKANIEFKKLIDKINE